MGRGKKRPGTTRTRTMKIRERYSSTCPVPQYQDETGVYGAGCCFDLMEVLLARATP